MHATTKQINTINKLLRQNCYNSLSDYIVDESSDINISVASFIISILLDNEEIDKQELVAPHSRYLQYFTFIG